jgi:hypothetical protein
MEGAVYGYGIGQGGGVGRENVFPEPTAKSAECDSRATQPDDHGRTAHGRMLAVHLIDL